MRVPPPRRAPFHAPAAARPLPLLRMPTPLLDRRVRRVASTTPTSAMWVASRPPRRPTMAGARCSPPHTAWRIAVAGLHGTLCLRLRPAGRPAFSRRTAAARARPAERPSERARNSAARVCIFKRARAFRVRDRRRSASHTHTRTIATVARGRRARVRSHPAPVRTHPVSFSPSLSHPGDNHGGRCCAAQVGTLSHTPTPAYSHARAAHDARAHHGVRAAAAILAA